MCCVPSGGGDRADGWRRRRLGNGKRMMKQQLEKAEQEYHKVKVDTAEVVL